MNGHWLRLEGRVCAVTGAAGGIGKAIASELVAGGAHVVLLDRSAEAGRAAAQEIDPAGTSTLPLTCDVSDTDSVAAAQADLRKAIGPADVLVNNAAVLRSGALDSISIEDWNALLDVNLSGYLRCAQIFGREMLAHGRGSIVHIASIAGSHPQAFSGAYSAGKAAVAMLSRQLAFEWGPRGVRSNCISPGMIETPLSAEFYKAPGVREKREAVVPLRRIGQPHDIASVAAFLSSDRASYVNGQDIVVDGGFAQTLMSHIPRPGYD